MFKKVGACVVLFNPDVAVISNIESYYEYVEELILIDNSPSRKNYVEAFFQKKNYEKITYKFLNKNIGIAAALNISCKIAIEKNCSWLLTMDQDSSFNANGLNNMIADIDDIEKLFKNVGIITPYHKLHEGESANIKNKFIKRKIAMTSGNLLSLKAYISTGPFNEKLFIDFVDYEYCLRLRLNNYLIIQNNFVSLTHSLGNFTIKKLLGQKIGISNHNHIRRYYITRNSLFVGFKYFKYDKIFFISVIKNIFFWDPFIVLFFEKNSLLKLKSIAKGIKHFLLNKYDVLPAEKI